MSDRTSGKVVEPVATEMVRRVAAAIALAEKTNPAWRANPDSWIEWVDTARAAIEAMREPTGPMVTAGIKDGIEGEGVHAGRRWPAAVTERWQLMIRASLNEGEAQR